MDYDAIVQEHLQAAAALTMVTPKVPEGEDPGRFGVVQVEAGRVSGYAYKPEQPDGDLIATEVFAADPDVLLDTLEQLAKSAGEYGLKDLGDGVLPTLVEAGKTAELRHTGYWRDVGTVPPYWRGHQDLLGDNPAFALDDGELPLLTRVTRTGPRRCAPPPR